MSILTIYWIVFSVKSIILVGIENQRFKGTIILVVFDLQGIFWKELLYLFGSTMIFRVCMVSNVVF